MNLVSDVVNTISFNIDALTSTLDDALQNKLDNKTKPQGSLGELECLAFQLGRIQQTLTPKIEKPSMLVFAADHGVVAQNVSPFPQAVTQQMLGNFLAGGAAVSVFCQQHQVPLHVIDVGVNNNTPVEFLSSTLFSDRKVAQGTKDFSQEAAMNHAEYQQALQVGIEAVDAAYNAGSNLVMFGEMGIGNTTTAACLMSCITGLKAEDCVGPGTGSSVDGIAHKANVIRLTQERIKHAHSLSDRKQTNASNTLTINELPIETIIKECGGFEIVAMMGAMLRAAEQKISFVVDGFICTMALLMAKEINQHVEQYAFFSHESKETAHKALLDYLQAKPLLSLHLRLGEGSGAILALPLLQSATLFMEKMASFASAEISKEI